MAKSWLLLIFLSCNFSLLIAQKSLEAYEQEIQAYADTMMIGMSEFQRLNACYKLIPKLVKALKEPNSFEYPFDKVGTISILTASDQSFRVFSWQVLRDNATVRHFGAIQMNNKDSLALFPFFDASDFTDSVEKKVLDYKEWYGCIYYKLLEEKFFGKTYYTLLGWDANDSKSDKKIIEPLTFKEGKPVFGKPIIVHNKDSVHTRFILEYKDGEERQVEDQEGRIITYEESVSVGLNYDDELKSILFDHLIPETPLTKGQYNTYVPDGSYSAFEFKRGKWRFVDKVFDQTFSEPPGPNTQQ